MLVVQKIACLAMFVFGSTQAGVLSVEQCDLTDKSCMVSSAQKLLPGFIAGMSQYNVGQQDPLLLDDIRFDLSGLKFSYTKSFVEGLKSAVIKDFDWDTKSKMFTITFYMDLYTKGDYTAAGHVGEKPISGDGVLTIKMKKLLVKFTIHYDLVKKGDKDHLKLTKHSYEFDVEQNAHYDLTNLFDGDKERSDDMLTFLNENWKHISTEFSPPLLDGITAKLFKNCGNFFDSIPIGDIAKV